MNLEKKMLLRQFCKSARFVYLCNTLITNMRCFRKGHGLYVTMQLVYWLWRVCSCKRPPTIGIMTQELPVRTAEFSSYIYTQYVKAVESSGAQVVPIFKNQTEQYYRDILHKINGVLIPGGSADFLEKGGVGPSTEIVISIAKEVGSCALGELAAVESNRAVSSLLHSGSSNIPVCHIGPILELNNVKDHFPILGICWGFQILLFLSNKKRGLMKQCSCKNMSLSLEFQSKIWTKSRLLRRMPTSIYNTLKTPVTFNKHKWCVTERNFSANHMEREWMILSSSTKSGKKGKLKFVSGIESLRYPFVGLQFHPEMTPFSLKNLAIVRSREAILAARFFYDWLVDEAALSNHSFPSPRDEFKSLIWNYHPHFVKTTPQTQPDAQYYLFR